MARLTRTLTLALIGAALLLQPATARAEFPEKTIVWVAAFGAGGGTDRWARVLSTVAYDVLGVPIRVRNMPGASGVVAWKHVLDQPADGYTIYHGSSTPVLGLLAEEKAPFGPDRLKVVAYVSQFRSILMAPPGKPWSDWEGFKAYARANPGKISIAGTLSLLLGVAVVLEEEGLDVTYVPYPGTGQAMTDFLGGHVSAGAGTASTALGLVPEKATAVLNTSALPLSDSAAEKLGNPPLASELGYKKAMNFPNLVGVHPDTPDDIADLLSEKVGEMLEQKSVNRLISRMGEEIIYLPRERATVAYDKMVESMKEGLKYLQ